MFYDHGTHSPRVPPGGPDEDGDRFIEVWNLVFMQYEQLNPETRRELPRPSIDTGMGLERVAAVLQGKHDNYDTDLLRAIIEASAEASGQSPDRSEEHTSELQSLMRSSYAVFRLKKQHTEQRYKRQNTKD